LILRTDRKYSIRFRNVQLSLPEDGERGGKIVVAGTPEKVAKTPESYTGKYLAEMLN
jgi:excinuclease UvrABC ATPase subunit